MRVSEAATTRSQRRGSSRFVEHFEGGLVGLVVSRAAEHPDRRSVLVGGIARTRSRSLCAGVCTCVARSPRSSTISRIACKTYCSSASVISPRPRLELGCAQSVESAFRRKDLLRLRLQVLEDEVLCFVLVASQQPLVKADAGIKGRLVAQNDRQELELRNIAAQHHQAHRQRAGEHQSDRPPEKGPERGR